MELWGLINQNEAFRDLYKFQGLSSFYLGRQIFTLKA